MPAISAAYMEFHDILFSINALQYYMSKRCGVLDILKQDFKCEKLNRTLENINNK